MSEVNPLKVLQKVANDIPSDCRENIIIIGSLAAGYAFFSDNEDMMVQTKDVDCLVRPRVVAAQKAEF
jgi:hypothetical protein